MTKAAKISTTGGSGLDQTPFAALAGLGELRDLPAGPGSPTTPAGSQASSKREQPNLNRGRVEVRRLTGGKGGKTVTSVTGFVGIGLPEKEQLAKRMQKTCGCGGTVKEGAIEIQGDKREQVADILRAAGFRPVMAGG